MLSSSFHCSLDTDGKVDCSVIALGDPLFGFSFAVMVADLASSVAKKTADCATGGAAFVRALSHHGNAEAN